MTGEALGVSQPGTRAWCNLCRAEGKTYELDADAPDWVKTMQQHSLMFHREHEEALRRGEPYIPVEVEP